MSEQMRSYGTARGIFSFLEFIGWSVVVIGIIVGFVLAGGARRYASDGQKFMLFLLGGSSSLIGLFFVGAVQHWRAGVDSAEYGQQMLKLARDQLAVSKQGLISQNTDKQTFSKVEGVDAEKDAPSATRHSFSPPKPKPKMQRSGKHRGESIIEAYGAYRAMGATFPNYQEAVSAIDQKLDAPAFEDKPEVPIFHQPVPDTVPLNGEAQTVAETRASDKLEGEARLLARSAIDTMKTPTSSDVQKVDTPKNLVAETVTIDESTRPHPAEEHINLTSRIKEESGKFVYGRMEFSSREAAEKYVSQLGVNPNFRK